ncbi:sulfite oxidase [Mycobacterium bourgelatii]|uniref:Sulfite oxidase n=1 Tax=Mycobacterium bourgelatii TaxID=1273442 RepID=A0A7I9YRV3_MYCBU|nr:sulfite oxidase [Mycobacterium bourgelatii]MCV6974188.1 sulfite oxidase [Mycobacterium bourgelatii]GFG91355.1 sulfite oxidase [Mycobacterium bourgelatii]
MVVHETTPFNAEPPLAVLARAEITPVGDFYSRNHGPVPKIQPTDWQLSVNGLVERELALTYDELTSRFRPHTLIATLQCAGNRRAGFNEIEEIEGEDPWRGGATSTAKWRGARLADVLAAAGVTDPDGRHVAFTAPDVSELASPPQEYGSSIPLSKALSPEVLLAWEMNGEPLPEVHGGPVRVVVPGYIGARSVKWVTGITVQDKPSDNYFQAHAYHVLPADADPETTDPSAGISLSSIALNSEILVPEDGTSVSAGRQTVRGYAFAGDGRFIERVDVSLDAGRSWRQAELQPQRSPWSWRMWSCVADLAPGEVEIVARAWDSSGTMQPESAAKLWNPKGYANNAWPRARVTVCE